MHCGFQKWGSDVKCVVSMQVERLLHALACEQAGLSSFAVSVSVDIYVCMYSVQWAKPCYLCMGILMRQVIIRHVKLNSKALSATLLYLVIAGKVTRFLPATVSLTCSAVIIGPLTCHSRRGTGVTVLIALITKGSVPFKPCQ